jgi:hypothetical protein
MLDAGFSESDVDLVLYRNPIEFYAQSGRISIEDMAPVKVDQRQLYAENSVLRGQTPVIE